MYYVGFSAQARTATEFAVSILEKLLPGGSNVTIAASWERITTAGVLGSTSITGYVAGWNIDALNPLAIYPLSLAEKIAGEKFNPDAEGDMKLTLNSSIDWYYGTDGKTPTSKYDLVTVVLHELMHGLGFFNSFSVSGTQGFYGLSSYPLIFDTFVETLDGSRLTDTTKFKNYSTQLLTQMTGGRLWFNGPVLKSYTNGSRARLYAPSSYSSGSSISHLDEDQTLKLEALMTPFIDYGEAIHDPGVVTEGILADLGWIDTRITHTPGSDTEENLSSINLEAEVRSDTTFNRDKVSVVYSFDGFKTEQTKFLVPGSSPEIFRTSINIPAYNTGLQYYFSVEDYFGRIYRLPSLNDRFRFQVYIGTDTVRPVISHTPADYILETVDSLSFSASAVDNIGIDTVYLEYKVNNQALRYAGFAYLDSGRYRLTVPAAPLALSGGDSLRYRIVAIDSSSSRNAAYFPSKGYISIGVEEIKSPVDAYATNFSAAENDFFNVGFTLSMPRDFTSKALHSPHPYESPEDNEKHFDYTALLRYPLRFGESGLIFRYREIVLVEPGESGSLFGSESFYDYVVMEASKDNGQTWFALEDGYDSRRDPLWESLYNNSIDNGNSTFRPVESQLKDHFLYVPPSSRIAAGDVLLIRFRLYSDPFANGWGWVIDDLKINPLIDSVEEMRNSPFTLYPNPGNGLIRIRNTPAEGRVLQYSVVNSSGVKVCTGTVDGGAGSVIDISFLPKGFYIITISDGLNLNRLKYSLVR